MGCDDDMSDDYEFWLEDVELIYEADKWNKEQICLAEESLVGRVREEIEKVKCNHDSEMYKDIPDYPVGYDNALEYVLSLDILSAPKPKGDE